MKITLFILGLLSLATLTNAGTFLEARNRALDNQVLSPEKLVNNLKQTDFGKSILNLLSLQFKTSGKLDDVTQLITGLQNTLRQQQNDEDQSYTQTTASNNKIIQDQTNIIDVANANIKAFTQQLTDARSQLSQLQITQQQLIQDRAAITALIQKITDIRQNEAQAFAKRTENSKTLITGIQKTIDLFQKAVANKQFDQAAVDKLNGLLKSLEASFVASIAQDQQQENQAIQDFQDFLADRNAKLAEIAEKLAAIALEITRLQTLVTQLSDAIVAQTTTRDNAQILKDRTIQAQKDLDAKYNNNKAVRADQIRLLINAIQTLSQNSSEVQGYLNQA